MIGIFLDPFGKHQHFSASTTTLHGIHVDHFFQGGVFSKNNELTEVMGKDFNVSVTKPVVYIFSVQRFLPWFKSLCVFNTFLVPVPGYNSYTILHFWILHNMGNLYFDPGSFRNVIIAVKLKLTHGSNNTVTILHKMTKFIKVVIHVSQDHTVESFTHM